MSWVLRERLKGFLSNFTSANLGLQVTKGILNLTDFSLLPEAFASLGLPFTVKTARIQKLELLLPWRQSPPGPLVVRLQGLRLVVGSIGSDCSAEELRKWVQRLKLQELNVDTPAEPKASTPAPAPSLDASQLQAVIDALLRDLHVNVSDLAVRFEEGVHLPAVQLTLHSLQLRCQRQQTLPRLLSFCFARRTRQTDEHSCDWHLEAVVGVAWHPSGSSTGRGADTGSAPPAIDILRQLSVRSNLRMRIQWPSSARHPVLAGAAAVTAPKLQLEGSVDVTHIQFSLSHEQLSWAARRNFICEQYIAAALCFSHPRPLLSTP